MGGGAGLHGGQAHPAADGGRADARAAGRGDGGGEVIAKGSPEEVAEIKGSYTGYFLNKIFNLEKNQ